MAMLPHVILHNSVSVDGRLTGFDADIGLHYELAAQWAVDAHLAGSNTILRQAEQVTPEDDTVFEPPLKTPTDTRPLLVVPDSRGRIHTWHMLRTMPYWRDMVVLCSQATPKSYLDYLQKRHIDAIVSGDYHVDLRTALETLNERYRVKTIHLDGGGTLNGVMLRAGLVDEISMLIHPNLVGGTSPSSMFQAPDLTSPDGIIRLKFGHVEAMKDGLVWLRYRVIK